MSYQADTLGRNIRHALPGDSKEQWDQLKEEYWRTKRSRNEIALVQDLIAIGLAFMAGQPNAERS